MSVLNNSSVLLLKPATSSGYQVSRSLRFNSSDSSFCSRVFGSSGSSTWTFSCWMKLSASYTDGGYRKIFGLSSQNNGIFLYSGNVIALNDNNSNDYSVATLRDFSAWYHLVVRSNGSANTVYLNNIQLTFGSTTVAAGLGLNGNVEHRIGKQSGGSVIGQYAFDGYLADVHFIDGQALTPSSFGETDATTSAWNPKAYSGTYGTNGFKLTFSDNSNNTATTLGKDTSGNSNNWTPNNFSVTGLVNYVSSGLSYRDSTSTNQNWNSSSTSSSTSNAIGPDRIWWVDLGSSQSFNRVTFNVIGSGQSSDTSTNFIVYFSTSASSNGSSICGGGCTVASASKPSGTTPGTITVTFAGFANQTGRYIGITSGSGTQGGTYTYSNLQVSDDQGKDNDSLVDSPTNYGTDTGTGGEVRGNYCTLNPLTSGFGGTLSNGNLDYSLEAGTRRAEGTIAVTSGKWWWEALAVSGTTNGTVGGRFGFCVQSSLNNPESIAFGLHWHATSGVQRVVSGSFTTVLTGTNYTDSDLLACALDADANIAYFYKNGTLVYTYDFSSFVTVGSAPLTPHCWNASSGTPVWTYNFGQRVWANTPRSSHKALCTQNLPTPVIARPSTVMDVLLWTGTGTGADRTISGLNFTNTPGLIWGKGRSAGYHHTLWDVVRGYGQSNVLSSDRTEAAGWTASGRIKSANSSSITWEADSGSLWYDGSSTTYAAWCWDAGSSTVTNTQGSITSSVRANTSAGFSIVTFNSGSSGAKTIGHGLNAVPSLLICKNRESTANWTVYHSSATSISQYLLLNSQNGVGGSSNIWGNAAPTSTVFGFDSGNNQAANSNIICYAFAPVAGYSSMGIYVANNSADGPFVYTGFRPKLVIIKCYDSTSSWALYDSARGSYNTIGDTLLADSANQENNPDYGNIDFLSNGFKIRSGAGAYINNTPDDFIYCAWAESPFAYARAR